MKKYVNPFSEYFSTQYDASFSDDLKFNIKSFLGRLIYNKKPPNLKTSEKLLNLGCANRIFSNWVNADFFTIKPWSRINKNKIGINWELDLRYPLNCEDNYWDGIFMEHVLEHLKAKNAINLLKELYRTLKPGSHIRISVPDLQKYIDFYLGRNPYIFDLPYKALVIYRLVYNAGHRSCYDYEIIKEMLKQTGFKKINRSVFGKSIDNRLIMDSIERKNVTLYVEAQK
jgi:predicted SAM-dependent methyltransferase